MNIAKLVRHDRYVAGTLLYMQHALEMLMSGNPLPAKHPTTILLVRAARALARDIKANEKIRKKILRAIEKKQKANR